MAGGKRASMREGPLAALFQRTDVKTRPEERARATPRSGRRAARRSRQREREQRRAAQPAPDRGRVERRRIPSPKERLSAAFSQDIPTTCSSARRAEREYRPRDEPEIRRTAVRQPVLRVVGVGGAGVNAVEPHDRGGRRGRRVHRRQHRPPVARSRAPPHVTLHIGSEITHGLGSGSDPESAARRRSPTTTASRAMLKGSDMVFVTAGEGGGTGTGAAPVVARIAQEIGALTVGIVTKPFGFEGTRRASQADEGVGELAKHVDTLIVIPNNRLLSVLEKGTSMVDAFRVADDVLRQGVQGISDLVTLPGLINLDFADVRTIMSDAGQALLGIGMATGERGRSRPPRRPCRRRCSRPRSRVRGRSCSRSPAAATSRCGRSTRPRGPSRRRHTRARTSSSAR